MNKKVFGIIGVILIIVLLIASCSLSPKEESDTTDTLTIATKEAASIKEEEKKEFTNINIDEYINAYNGEEKTLVLVARPTCHYCQIAEPILHNIAYKYSININYLDTDDFQEDDFQKFIESNEYFSEGFGTPMLLVVSNGTINDIVDGVTDTKHYIEFLKEYKFIK